MHSMGRYQLSTRDLALVLAAYDDAHFARRLQQESNAERLRAAVAYEIERPQPTRQERIARLNQRIKTVS